MLINRMLLKSLCLFVMVGLMCGNSAASEQAIKLSLNTAKTNDLTVKDLGGGEYEISTTGVDPYVLTKKLSKPVGTNTLSVLSFETFAFKGIKNVQVFFAPPIAEAHSVSGLKIESSEGWVPFSVNLMQSPQWKKGKNSFRIDFGTKPQRTFRIRNLQLRELNKEELEDLAVSAKETLKKVALEKDISRYFSRTYPEQITSVVPSKDSVAVTYKASENCILAEIRPWQTVQQHSSIDTLEWSQAVMAGSQTVTIPRFTKTGEVPYDRLHSKWVLLKPNKPNIELASHAVYCSDDSGTTLKTIPVPKPSTKKGLNISWRPDNMKMLDELGIKHATVNIELCSLLNVPVGAPYIEHSYMGKTFRLNKGAIDRQTKVLAYAAKKKYLVGAILLISKNAPKGFKKIMLHPDYNSRGIYSMANVTSPDGVFYYGMLVDFLASYFSNEEHGYLHYWIIHNEVDAAWVWTNCGTRGAESMMDFYVKSMRLVSLTVRKYNPQARVMISLTHFWNKKNTHGPADAMYAPRHLLDILSEHSRVEGDFDWGLAYHPYPKDLRNPEVWNDSVQWRFDADIISYKNLEVLVAYMKKPQFLYKGERRKIHLTEQGFSNPNDSGKSLQIQAAAMAYGMKKINGLDGIDVHILHRWVDHGREGGLNLGLVKKKPGTIATAGEKKPSFTVYAAIDTPREEEACSFALKIIGIKDWSEIFHKDAIR